MSNSAIIAIAIVVAVVLAAIVFVTTARRSDVRGAGALSAETRKRDEESRRAREQAEAAARRSVPVSRTATDDTSAAPGSAIAPSAPAAAPVPWTPPDPEVIGVSRRMFFNRATVSLMSASIGAFTVAGFVAFLWPSSTGGFGQVVGVGSVEGVRDGARAAAGFFYAPEARAWITEYPSEALPKAEAVYDPAIYAGMASYGLVALYQKCPHLGCRVPQCDTSRWFECPCHGSQYNQVGEKKAGPAPRGMDHFRIAVDAAGGLSIDTGTIYTGVPLGTNTTGQEAEGPHCITGGGDH